MGSEVGEFAGAGMGEGSGDGAAGDAGFTSAKLGNGGELGPIGAGETLGVIGGDGFRVEAPGERVGG